jgi:hypothetical protein
MRDAKMLVRTSSSREGVYGDTEEVVRCWKDLLSTWHRGVHTGEVERRSDGNSGGQLLLRTRTVTVTCAMTRDKQEQNGL